MTSESNKRIAKNTFFLYVRMIVSIVVNLYTVRLLWQVLGVDDYGIYNLVGGIVLMFAFLNNAMIASSQRFISFELGRGDSERLRKTFSISVSVHVLLAVLVFVLAETIGLWFLNYKLNIPVGRMSAANWVYQCSVMAFLLNIVSVPYNACIVAHEHMKVYGYFGILDVMLKLGIVLLVARLPGDSLIEYALLILAVSATMRLIYGVYCSRHFEECKFRKFKDRALMREMFSFAGWSFLGNMGFSVRDQGINILLNVFFNVAVNAAKGIANQVGGVINGFASNFTMAVNPQITKRYATGEVESMMNLVYNGCKFALLLMSIVVVPLLVSAELILSMWLGNVAEYTVGFLRLVLLMSLVDCVVSPITTALQATGHIKKFQIIISIIMTLNIPLSWIWLSFDSNPYIVMVVCIAMSVVALLARLMLLHSLVRFSYFKFVKIVYARTIPCILLAMLFNFGIFQFVSKDFTGMIIYAGLGLILMCLTLYLIGLKKTERQLVNNEIAKRLG
ncbi:MAG: oligosaccharide flippase family protein [Duncaniella sp.]|nr:oligosaccharide flippase family protein [Duncaniella sp.]MDE6465770.1 oligosaccharide flippase family protein [Duncaniella sp.]MDE6573560.1 oligosaccharide flippase family protein [Duncaniella sp.]